MPSDWEQVCSAIATDLTDPGRPLNGAVVHKLTPWDPEELDASDGKRHLAVWPAGEGGAEDAVPAATGSHELMQTFMVMVWEPAEEEASRGVRDEAQAAAWLQLHNDVRGRFYVESNQLMGGSAPLWYRGATFPDRVSKVRWMAIALAASRYQAFA